MPAGDPELGRSRGDRQLLGNNLENSDTRSGHAHDCPPTPGQAAPGDRRNLSLNPSTGCDLCPDSWETYHLGHMS